MANYTTTSTVMLNGEQAEDMLIKLKKRSEELGEQWKKFSEAGDAAGMKKVEKQIQSVDKATEKLTKDTLSVEKVLKNLSGASLSDLVTVQKKLNAEMAKMDRNSAEFKEAAKNAAILKNEIAQTKIAMGQWSSPMEKALGFAKNLLPMFSFAAIAAGAKAAFDQVVNSTDTLSTKWAVFMGGLKGATSEFWRTLATGDWSNFMGNMRSAIDVGREYERMLDDIEAKQRSLNKAEADARMEMRTLEDTVRNVTLSNDERVAAAEKRIKLEEKLAKQRSDLAQKEYESELSLAMQASKLDEKRLLEQIDAKSVETELHAKTLIELRERYAELQKANQVVVGGVKVNGPSTPEMQQIKTEMSKYPAFIAEYANNMEKIGNVTDEQLNKLIASYEKIKGAEASALENTKKVRSAMYSIFDEENRNAKSGEKSGIKDTESLVDKTRKFLIPEEDAPIKNIGEAQAIREAELLAEKKAGEAEWTKFLKEQIDARVKAGEEELAKEIERVETEKEIDEARVELKRATLDAAGQLAGQIASMAKEGSAAQIAALAVEKSAAIAQIIWNTFVANAKARALFPLTGGLPWTAINTALAAANIATIVGTTISGFKDKKNNNTKGYAAGKYPGLQTGMYGSEPHMAVFNEVPGRPEMVIDGVTLRNIQLNAPAIIESIYAVRDGRIPQYAAGKYPSFGDIDTSKLSGFAAMINGRVMDIEQNKILKELANEIKELRKWKPKVYTEMIKKDLENLADIEKKRSL